MFGTMLISSVVFLFCIRKLTTNLQSTVPYIGREGGREGEEGGMGEREGGNGLSWQSFHYFTEVSQRRLRVEHLFWSQTHRCTFFRSKPVY